MNQSLAKRVFRAGSWSIAGFFFARFIGLVRLTILGRLLIPVDFGLFALVTLFIGGVAALSDIGIVSAVIQRRDTNQVFLSTAWHLGWMRGMLLSAICWMAAPWVADFFSHSELTELLHIAAFIPLIQGLSSMGVALLNRSLAFDRLLIVTISHEVVQTIAAIGLAWWLGWGASALVYGLLAGHVFSVLVSYLIHDFRPLPRFSRDSARAIWAYGGHLLGAGVLIYAMTNLDDAVIGRLLGTEALGYYAVAFMLAGYLTSKVVALSNKVMFPAYAGIQSDTDRVLRVIRQHARLTTMVLTPMVVGAALLPDAVIRLAVGRQWLPAVSVFVVLLIMGWIRGCATVFGPVLMARGRTRAIHKMKWAEFIVFAIFIIPFVYFFGAIGAAWTLTVVYLLSLMLHLWLVKEDLQIRLKPVVSELLAGAVPGLVAGGVTYMFIKMFRTHLGHWSWGAALVFVAVWGCVLWVRDREFVGGIWSRVKERGGRARRSGRRVPGEW